MYSGYNSYNNDSLFSFENSMIIMLMAIVFLMFLKLEKCDKCSIDNFELETDMNTDESKFVMKKNKFDISCCDSEYTNDNGCICIKQDIPKEIRNRGGNNSK